MQKGKVSLDLETFEAMANHEGALVLDTRNEVNLPKRIFLIPYL